MSGISNVQYLGRFTVITKLTRSPWTTSVCFSVVTVNDEYRKPEFKSGVKFKEGSRLKANGIFVILLSLDVFESDSPERKP